jgi:hypothetical protein
MTLVASLFASVQTKRYTRTCARKNVLCGQEVDKRETHPKKKLRKATHMDENKKKG